MKLIDRFVSRELIVNVLFAIAVLSLVLVVGNIFRKLLPLLVNHDVPMEYLITFIAYVLPFSLIFTIPWGLLTAILLVFGRLSADNELIALRANGVSVPRVCVSLWGVALICTVICLWLNVQVAPAAQEKLRSTIFDLATRNPMALFGSDQVIDQFPGRKIYVGKKEGNKLENITVFELNQNSMPVKVTYARTGMLEADLANKQILMHLYQARYQERDQKDPSNLRKIRDGINMVEGASPGDFNRIRNGFNRSYHLFSLYHHWRYAAWKSACAPGTARLVSKRSFHHTWLPLVPAVGTAIGREYFVTGQWWHTVVVFNRR